MGPRPRASRQVRSPSGQHFLRSRRLAAELVSQAGIRADDLVLEIGAGRGRLTAELASRAGRVLAVERDPMLAAGLRRRFARDDTVTVICGDVLRVQLPREPFRAFGNIPFGITTRLLHKLLDDPSLPLVRADLIVQWEVARKRAARRPSTLLSLGWRPWWRLSVVSRLDPACFDPSPHVGAAVLRISRRDPPLLPPRERIPYVRLLRMAFAHPSVPVRLSLRPVLTARQAKRLARDHGFGGDAVPMDLDVRQWVGIWSFIRGLPPGT